MSKWSYKVVNYTDQVTLEFDIDENIAAKLSDPFLPLPRLIVVMAKRWSTLP